METTMQTADAALPGMLTVPSTAMGMVAFAHCYGRDRRRSRNQNIAAFLNEAGLGTLLFDLLTKHENRIDEVRAHLRLDIPLLGARLASVADWLKSFSITEALPLGLFGAGAGAAAALCAAAIRPDDVFAVVSRGGRLDLANGKLSAIRAPTLLIVGGEDKLVIEMNREAGAEFTCEWRLEIVPGATHFFEEPGSMEQVALLTREWFRRHLNK